jgi:hypothetical protein
MAWCYRAQEKLRKLHNVMGTWFKDGITEAKWNQLPNKARVRYPYKAQLTETEIITAMLENRALAKASTHWPVDLDGDIA